MLRSLATAVLLALAVVVALLSPSLAHAADPFRAFARLATAVVNDTFVASDYGVDMIAARVVLPAPVVDTATPLVSFSVETSPAVGCINMRIVADVDRDCAVAIYCDLAGEGTSSLAITGGCDDSAPVLSTAASDAGVAVSLRVR